MLFLKLLLAKEDPQELLRGNLNLKGWWAGRDLPVWVQIAPIPAVSSGLLIVGLGDIFHP